LQLVIWRRARATVLLVVVERLGNLYLRRGRLGRDVLRAVAGLLVGLAASSGAERDDAAVSEPPVDA
jgi:hypothetical protein